MELPEGFKFATCNMDIRYSVRRGMGKYIYTNIDYGGVNYPEAVLVVHENPYYYKLQIYNDDEMVVKIIMNYENEGFVEVEPLEFSLNEIHYPER